MIEGEEDLRTKCSLHPAGIFIVISLDLSKVTHMPEVKYAYLQNVVLALRNRCF